MGFFKKVKKAFKKVVKGIGKVFKAVGKVVKKVGSALKSGFKKLTSSTLGKVVLAAAAIYVGGALYGMSQAGGGMAAGEAFQVGNAFAKAGEGVAKLGDLVKTKLGGPPADPGATEAVVQQTGKTAAEKTFENTVVETGKQAVETAAQRTAEEEAKKGILTNVLDKTKDVASGLKDWAGDNQLLAYGGLQVGGNVLASMNAPDEEDLMQKEYDLRAQEQRRLVENNIVPNISPGILGAYKYRSPGEQAADTSISSLNAPKAPMQGLLSRSEYV